MIAKIRAWLDSGIFKLGLGDLAKGLVVAILTAILTSCQQLLSTGADPATWNWRAIGLVGLAAGVGYVLKNLLSTNDGKFAGKVG